jgi:hypothetical protein
MPQDSETEQQDVYKDFIDRIVGLAQSNVTTRRIRQNGHSERTNEADRPLTPPEAARKALVQSLTPEARQVLEEMLQDQRESALHDLLSMIEEEISAGSLEIISKGTALRESPFGSYHFDFICRLEGDDWPGSEQ